MISSYAGKDWKESDSGQDYLDRFGKNRKERKTLEAQNKKAANLAAFLVFNVIQFRYKKVTRRSDFVELTFGSVCAHKHTAVLLSEFLASHSGW